MSDAIAIANVKVHDTQVANRARDRSGVVLGKSVVFAAQSAPKQNESAAVLFQACQWTILACEWYLMPILTLWGLFLPKTIMVSNQGNRHFRRIKTKHVGRGCTHQRQEENSTQTNPDDPWRTKIITSDDSGRCSDQRSFILPNADPWSSVLRSRKRPVTCRNASCGVSCD